MAAGGLSSIPVQAAVSPPAFHTVTLGWNPVPSPVQSYRLHFGTESQQYTQALDSGGETSLAINGVEFGKTYFFAVSSVDSEGLESPLSTEVKVTIAPPPLPAGGTMALNASGQAGLEWTFPRSELGSSPEFIIEASTDLANWSPVDTVLPSQSIGGDAQLAKFSWPVEISGGRRFYRLTSRNWMGFATR